MRRLGALIPTVLAVAALIAGACGSPEEGRGLRALPRGGGSGGAESAAMSMVADDASAGVSRYRPVVYEAGEALGRGLPASAPAHELVGEASEADVRRLAGLLGMAGDVESEDGAYVVEDGTLRLEVQRSTGAAWYAFDQRDIAGVATSCAVAVEPDRPVSSEELEERAAAEPQPACEEPPPVEGLLSAAETERRAREILDGLDHEGITYSFDADGPSGGPSTSVNVSAALDGRPVPDLTMWFSFGPEGVVLAAQGWLGTFRAIGDYPLAGVAAGIERLNEREVGGVALGAPEPGIAVSGPVADCPPEADCIASEPGTDPAGEPQAKPEPEPEPRPAPEPEVVVLDEVRIGYVVMWGGCEGDPMLLVPAYLFAMPGDGGGELSVEAVADEHLETEGSGDDERDACDDADGGDEPAREPRPADGGAVPGSPGAGGDSGSVGTGEGERLIDPVQPPPGDTQPSEPESKVATTTQ